MLSQYAIVTLETAKGFLKVDHEDDDALIELLIETASKKTADYCNSQWIQKEFTETHIGDGKVKLYLYRQPVVEVESVTINDEDYDDYTERLSSGYLWGSWAKDAEIVVTYTAGYISPESDSNINAVIPDACLAVLDCVADWYNNRIGVKAESVSGLGSVTYNDEYELPQSAKAKLSSLRKSLI
jgi:hypothetical protein